MYLPLTMNQEETTHILKRRVHGIPDVDPEVEKGES